jgi:hypothetical protein
MVLGALAAGTSTTSVRLMLDLVATARRRVISSWLDSLVARALVENDFEARQRGDDRWRQRLEGLEGALVTGVDNELVGGI